MLSVIMLCVILALCWVSWRPIVFRRFSYCFLINLTCFYKDMMIAEGYMEQRTLDIMGSNPLTLTFNIWPRFLKRDRLVYSLKASECMTDSLCLLIALHKFKFVCPWQPFVSAILSLLISVPVTASKLWMMLFKNQVLYWLCNHKCRDFQFFHPKDLVWSFAVGMTAH